MNRSRALLLVLPLALLLPGLLAADVVPASRQFEVAAPHVSWRPDIREPYLAATATSAGAHGFVVGWDLSYYDPEDFELPSGASEGCWLLPDGHRAEGHFSNWDSTIEGSTAITLARMDEAKLVAVWETWDWRNASVGFKLMNLGGELTQGSSLRISDYAEDLYDVGPTVASNGQGLFVIAWTRATAGTAQPLARVFGPDGAPLTPEIAVSEPKAVPSSVFLPDAHRVSAVGMDKDGNFVVLFDNVWGRRYDRTGQPLGEPFRIGTTSGSLQMAMRATGEFVVAWQAPVQRDVMLLARFAPDGQRLGNPVRQPGAVLASLAVDPAGRVALFWIDRQKGRRRAALAVFGPALERLSPVIYEPPASRDRQVNRTGVAFAADGRILTVWVGPRGAKAKDSILGRIWQVR